MERGGESDSSRVKTNQSTLRRGTVLLRELRNQGHFGHQDITKQSYEVALLIFSYH